MVATTIVGNFLGKAWTDRAFDGSFWDLDDSNRFHIRILDLAEMLLNLQATPGFGAKLEDLQKRQPEDTFAEMEGAKRIYQFGWTWNS